MKIRTAIKKILEVTEDNTSADVLLCKSILLKIINNFGDQNVEEVSMSRIAHFVSKELGLGDSYIHKILAKEKRYHWERAYHNRYIEQRPIRLPWEISKPTYFLAELFENKDFVPRRVLELGSGIGRDAIFMAKKGSEVYAVDISYIATKIAIDSAKKAKVKCKFFNRDIFKLNFKSGYFDLIFDRGCFHHIPFFLHDEYIKLVNRFLSSKGRFYLLCHRQQNLYENGLYPFLGRLTWLLNYLLKNQFEIYFTKNDIKLTFRDKFKIIKMDSFQEKTGDNLYSCFMQKRS
jgi:SAM-dependent methyltransferase